MCNDGPAMILAPKRSVISRGGGESFVVGVGDEIVIERLITLWLVHEPNADTKERWVARFLRNRFYVSGTAKWKILARTTFSVIS